MSPSPFGPAAAPPPEPPAAAAFVLEPLDPVHNASDHRAWMSSIDHIRATPGFGPDDRGGDRWPYPMSAEENLGDLERHAREFRDGVAFAYTVLEPGTADVIGCVYVNPDPTGRADAVVRCWVRSDHAALDGDLADTVRGWLAQEWGLGSVHFPGR